MKLKEIIICISFALILSFASFGFGCMVAYTTDTFWSHQEVSIVKLYDGLFVLSVCFLILSIVSVVLNVINIILRAWKSKKTKSDAYKPIKYRVVGTSTEGAKIDIIGMIDKTGSFDTPLPNGEYVMSEVFDPESLLIEGVHVPPEAAEKEGNQ